VGVKKKKKSPAAFQRRGRSNIIAGPFEFFGAVVDLLECVQMNHSTKKKGDL